MKEYDNAIKDIDKALEINPEYLVAIITKGEIYYDKGDYENACKYFNLGISKGFQKERIVTYLEKCK
jgi:tetratricopeptide (TPR) repeat protein